MENQLPNINEMNTIEAINWYTSKVAEVFNINNRVAGTYSDEYKDALLSWKQELNKKALEERKYILRG
jgi:hypothetical protein